MIAQSELIINPDGSVFHLHVKPNELSATIILVGDPERSAKIAARFDTIEHRSHNREFFTFTGTYNGKRISVISTGIGCDNIDIVVTEIDALFNVDFTTREPKKETTTLTIVRLGTSGSISETIKIGHYVASEYSVGIDGLAYFYKNSRAVRSVDKEDEFIAKSCWGLDLARPYIVKNDETLLSLFDDISIRGVTISAGGFYAPQGRVVRLPIAQNNYIDNVASAGVTNFEMEGAAIALLGRLLGHRTLTVCAIIAQRVDGDSNAHYGQIVDKLIDSVLEKLTK